MQPFKFRYVNEIVGTFVILVLVLLLVGIFLAGQAQQWFEPIHRYTLVFPPEGSLGLQENSEVVILGAVVGSLEKLSVDQDGNMTGRIAIKGDFYRFVRDNSMVIVKKKFLLAGDSYINISKGTGKMLEDGAELKCEKDTEITEFLEIEIENMMESVLPVIEQAQAALKEYTDVAAGINDPEGELSQLLSNMRTISDGLARGEGMAGGVLRDPAMAQDLKEIVSRMNKLAEQFQDMAGDISGEAKDARGMILQSRQTLQETQRLLEALQKHWLISGYVDHGEETTRIPASSIILPSGK
jgi:phospholipid/cholesterol/gamma-HCH transport system substrate-binding protein